MTNIRKAVLQQAITDYFKSVGENDIALSFEASSGSIIDFVAERSKPITNIALAAKLPKSGRAKVIQHQPKNSSLDEDTLKRLEVFCKAFDKMQISAEHHRFFQNKQHNGRSGIFKLSSTDRYMSNVHQVIYWVITGIRLPTDRVWKPLQSNHNSIEQAAKYLHDVVSPVFGVDFTTNCILGFDANGRRTNASAKQYVNIATLDVFNYIK